MTTKKIKFKPLYEYIAVEKITGKERVLDSGIILAENVHSTETYDRGIIVAVGNGKVSMDGKVIPLNVKLGDTIIYRKNTDFLIKENGNEYYIVSEGSVLGVE